MKAIIFLCIFTNLFFSAPSVAYASSSEVEVTHFFTHALIAYPEIAFAKNNHMRLAYDQDCLTVTEFKRLLQSLYEKNYMLIDINEVYSSEKNQPAFKKNFNFPKNKKPLVLSFDDINYYRKKMYLGMNDKLILDDNGNLATLSVNAKNQVNYDNETITVLENFIKKHPDFSYNNAKGVICLTGFDGILGYRTESDSNNRNSEIEKVKPLVNKLKELNWKFACHSYGHYHMSTISADKFIYDTDKWITEVEPLIGKTDIYCYPYGDWEITLKDNSISKKHRHLLDCGFKMFFGVGSKSFFNYLPYGNNVDGKVLFMDRKPVDGLSLRLLKNKYRQYFDTEKIYDKETRFIKMK